MAVIMFLFLEIVQHNYLINKTYTPTHTLHTYTHTLEIYNCMHPVSERTLYSLLNAHEQRFPRFLFSSHKSISIDDNTPVTIPATR